MNKSKSISQKGGEMLLVFREKQKNKNDTLLVNTLHLSAKSEYQNEKYQKSIDLINEAIEINKKTPDSQQYSIRLKHLLANCYHSINQYEKALEIFDFVVNHAKANKENRYILANSYRIQANIYYKQGDYKKSIDKSFMGEKYAISVSDDLEIAQNLKERAKALNQLKKYEEAEATIDKSIKIISKYGLTDDLATIYQVKGYIKYDKKDFESALLYFLKTAEISNKNNDTEKFSLVSIDIGLIYYDLKRYDKALLVYKKALEKTKRPFTKIQLLDNIGAVYWKQKQYAVALDYYQKSLTTKEYFNYSNPLINSLPNHELLKYIDAKRTFFVILQDKAICWLDYAKSSNNNKNYLKFALQTYEVADKLIDYMRYEHTGTQSKYFWRNKTRSTYESAIETCYLLKDYEKAIYFFEKSRSVLLNDKLNELGAKQKLSEEDLQKEADFQKQISEVNASIEKAKNAKQKSDLNNRLIDLQEQQDRFIRTLETKNPAYYQIKYDATTYNLKQIQEYLRDSGGGSLVEYFIGDSTTYAIVISPNTVSLKKLNFNVSNTQQFANLCSKKITIKAELNTFLDVGSEVYKSLILPLNLSNGHIIISQDGAFIPFEALSKSAIKPDYLLNDFMISYTYSAQFLLRNSPKKLFLPNNKFIGIAPVNFTQKLNPLNGSEKSIDNIAKGYFWSNQLVGQMGTKKAFLSNAKNYQIVQIYTHAFADSNETEPRIFFADSALKVSDLSMEDQFKTNLLVLSACKTGVGKIAKGEGVLSLARGFSMAGIPSTITSLWSIEDHDTYLLIELFYKYLKEGLPKDEALQKAKIEFIAISENAMPDAWAGYVLIGDSTSLDSHNYLMYWIVGILLLLILGYLIKKKTRFHGF